LKTPEEDDRDAGLLAITNPPDGDVVALALGDESRILGFVPKTQEIIRIPETKRKIEKKHPDVDQGNIAIISPIVPSGEGGA